MIDLFRSRALVLLVLGAAILSGCSQVRPGDTATEQETRVVRLAEQEYLEGHAGQGILLDVRRPDEYDDGHLVAARNIDALSDGFRSAIDALDRDATYFLYCRTGNRSGQAAAVMAEMGFKSLYNIGGFADLASAGADTSE